VAPSRAAPNLAALCFSLHVVAGLCAEHLLLEPSEGERDRLLDGLVDARHVFDALHRQSTSARPSSLSRCAWPFVLRPSTLCIGLRAEEIECAATRRPSDLPGHRAAILCRRCAASPCRPALCRNPAKNRVAPPLYLVSLLYHFACLAQPLVGQAATASVPGVPVLFVPVIAAPMFTMELWTGLRVEVLTLQVNASPPPP
jgi:hypothetical protein